MHELEKIKSILLEFPWDEYGLDFVTQDQTDWADDLSERIASEC